MGAMEERAFTEARQGRDNAFRASCNYTRLLPTLLVFLSHETDHKVSIKEPQAFSKSTTITVSHRLGKMDHWSAALSAENMVTSPFALQDRIGRQTGNQRHPVNVVGQTAERWKLMDDHRQRRRTRHKKGQDPRQFQVARSQGDFCSHRRLYLRMNKIQAFHSEIENVEKCECTDLGYWITYLPSMCFLLVLAK